MEASEIPVVLWHLPATSPQRRRAVSCLLAQVGEDLFELRMVSGDEVLHTEFFADPRALLARAQQLRRQQDEAATDSHDAPLP